MATSLAILSLMLILLSILSQTTKEWTIITTDELNNSEIVLHKGQYKLLKIMIHKNNNNLISNNQITLELTSNEFTLLNGPTISINHYESNEYNVYIGIECGKQISETQKISWRIQNSLVNNYDIKEFTILINNSQLIIDFDSSLPSIPFNSYGVFDIKEEIYNIKDIEIELTPNDGESPYIIYLRKYSINKKRKIADLKYTSSSKSTQLEVINQLKIINNDNCYILVHNEITFQVSLSKPPSITGEIKEILVHYLKINSIDENKTLLLTTKIPVSSVLLSCMATTTGKEFKDDEIRNQEYNPNQKNFFTQYFFNQPQHSADIKFVNLNREGEYRLKCILDNTSNDRVESTAFIIGRFKKADIILPLIPNFQNPVPAECVTWTFKSSLVSSDPFFKKSVDYCDNIFSGDHTKPYLSNGCISCELVNDINYSNKATICISSSSTCATTFKGDSVILFEESFVNQLNTSDLIRLNLQLENDYEVESTIIEIDNSSPDKEKLIGKGLIISEKTVKFNIDSKIDQDIECYFQEVTKDSFKYSFTDTDKDVKRVIHKGENIEIELKFPQAQRQNYYPYNIIANCFNLPNFNKHYYQTAPFPLMTFLHGEIIPEPDDNPFPKEECDKIPPLFPHCLNQTKNELKDLLSGSPKENNDDELEIFSYLSNKDQKTKLKKEISRIQSLTLKDQTNQVIKSAELLLRRDCNKQSNYKECRKQKKSNYRFLIANLKGHFLSCNIFITDLYKFGWNKFENNVKMVLIMLYLFTSNSDSLNPNDINILTKMPLCLIDSFDIIWANIKDTGDENNKLVKKDIVNMLIRTTSNLINILQYEQLDNHLDNTYSNSRLLYDDRVKKVKNAIDQAIDLLSKVDTSIVLDNSITVAALNKNAVYLYLRSNIIDSESIYSFEDKGIIIKLNEDYLFNSFPTHEIIISIYDFFPLLSLDNLIVFPTAVSIKLIQKNGKPIDKVSFVEKWPKLLFSHSEMAKPFKYCYFFDESNQELNHQGVKSEYINEGEKNYTVCILEHLTDFLVADEIRAGLPWWNIVLIIIAVLVVLGALGAYLMYKKKRLLAVDENDNLIN